MIYRIVTTALLAVLSACGGSEPTSTICTRADEGAVCSEPSSAEFAEVDQSWRVYLRTTVTNRIEYEDGGVLCALTRTRCILEECNFLGGNIASASEAIARCRENFLRD